jgi:hypothetical protein
VAALGFEMRDVQLLVLLAFVFVFGWAWMVCGGFAGAVVPQSGQRYDMVREAMRAHTFLPPGMSLAGGERCLHFLDMIAFG